jgi:hypothetical protein
MTASMELYRYTLTLRNGEVVTTDAMSYHDEAEPWLVFNDTVSTVLTIRADTVDRIARSPQPIGRQRVDELTDREPED